MQQRSQKPVGENPEKLKAKGLRLTAKTNENFVHLWQ
jgi:hypothetical protein